MSHNRWRNRPDAVSIGPIPTPVLAYYGMYEEGKSKIQTPSASVIAYRSTQSLSMTITKAPFRTLHEVYQNPLQIPKDDT